MITIVFLLVFVGIGVSVIVRVWTDSNTPLFARLVATFIGTMFVVGPGSAILRQLARLRQAAHGTSEAWESSGSPEADAAPRRKISRSLECPRCAAGLGPEYEVSPTGDVHCSYCKCWFNPDR